MESRWHGELKNPGQSAVARQGSFRQKLGSVDRAIQGTSLSRRALVSSHREMSLFTLPLGGSRGTSGEGSAGIKPD